MMDVQWCNRMFRQKTDVARMFDCAREANHLGNCDSPKAQEVRKDFFEGLRILNTITPIRGEANI